MPPSLQHQGNRITSLRSSKANEEWDAAKPPHNAGDVIKHDHHEWEIRNVEQDGSCWLFTAQDKSTLEQVQIHVMSIKAGGWSWDNVDAFKKETQQLQSLRHRNLPHVVAHWEKNVPSDVRQYRVLRHAGGGQPLQALLDRGWRPKERQLLHVGLELLKVVTHLSELRPPLRLLSLHPSNIILDVENIGKTGQPFCWVARLSSDSDRLLSLIASRHLPPDAMSPSPSSSCETFAVGASLLHAVAGRDPSTIEDINAVVMSAGLRHTISGDRKSVV